VGAFAIDRYPLLPTPELHATIAPAELDGVRNTVATVAQLYPEAGAAYIEVAGGVAAFAGAHSPFSKAFGVGALGPIDNGDVARISAFYESRNAKPRVFVTPLADPALGRALAAAGFAPAEYDSILVAVDPDAHALYDARISAASDLEAWIRASVAGFAERRNVAHDDTVARVVASSPNAIVLEAREGDAIVATAGLSVRGSCAVLFAASTLPEHRHRGWQLALIRDRIARARDAGARIIYAAAAIASISERNFIRCGFRTIYTRARWDLIAQFRNH
jgi:GNAT superfamily N-acetyltransferase